MDFVVKDLGLCDYNKALLNQNNTKTDLVNNSGKDTLFLLEHNHTYTLGKMQILAIFSIKTVNFSKLIEEEM